MAAAQSSIGQRRALLFPIPCSLFPRLCSQIPPECACNRMNQYNLIVYFFHLNVIWLTKNVIGLGRPNSLGLTSDLNRQILRSYADP
jgi:hypothetical protein